MDKCQKMVVPIAKGSEPYPCRMPHFKDGWCKRHHPESLARKEEEHRQRQLRGEAWKKEREAQAQTKTNAIKEAIVLLVDNGYRVEKATPTAL